MEEAKPFENTAIPAPLWAPVRVRNRDSGGGDEPSDQLSPVQVSTARDRFEILRGIEGQNSRPPGG